MTERINLLQVAQILAAAASQTLVIYTTGEAAWLAWDAAVRELERKQ
jgi:hypothetical protein